MLLCSSCFFAQEKPSSTETKAETPAPERKAQAQSSIDVLSDTMGFDFGPYLSDVRQRVRENWYPLIPESAQAPMMKRGIAAIEFAIMGNGSMRGLRLTENTNSGDAELDHAAFRGIYNSAPFPPLPDAFHGHYLALRMYFYYNLNNSPLEGAAAYALAHGVRPHGAIKARTNVHIWVPSAGYTVPSGGSEVLVAVVTGNPQTALKWSIAGSGCSGSTCGTIVDGLYSAPSAVPSPPMVTITATSEAGPSASASVPVEVVQPRPSH